MLVAPVMTYLARQRDVYLPSDHDSSDDSSSSSSSSSDSSNSTWWKRGSDGTFFRGGGWLKMEVKLYATRHLSNVKQTLFT